MLEVYGIFPKQQIFNIKNTIKDESYEITFSGNTQTSTILLFCQTIKPRFLHFSHNQVIMEQIIIILHPCGNQSMRKSFILPV
jgi:hypothetical protein